MPKSHVLRRERLGWIVLACFVVVVMFVSLPVSGRTAGAADLNLSSATPDSLFLGVSNGEYAPDAGGDPASINRAKQFERAKFPVQNQQIMGGGVLNPEPSDGQFDFTSLDARVKLMRDTGATIVITLCCSPDWMKGGTSGASDWSQIDVAPLASHYGDFAELATTIARRYKDVTHFIVWDGLKGFWDPVRDTWDIEAYTHLYNTVYDALKAVNSRIQVGGPYVPMNSYANVANMTNPSRLRGAWGTIDQRDLDAVTYWLKNAHGADFVAVEGDVANLDQSDVVPAPPQTAKFGAVNQWIRSLTPLPIWWAEMHLGEQQQAPPATSAELLKSALYVQATTGASLVLLWQPEGTPGECRLCMWSSTRQPGGGIGSATYKSIAPALGNYPVQAANFAN